MFQHVNLCHFYLEQIFSVTVICGIIVLQTLTSALQDSITTTFCKFPKFIGKTESNSAHDPKHDLHCEAVWRWKHYSDVFIFQGRIWAWPKTRSIYGNLLEFPSNLRFKKISMSCCILHIMPTLFHDHSVCDLLNKPSNIFAAYYTGHLRSVHPS